MFKAMLESNGTITKEMALDLVSTNLERLVGLDHAGSDGDLVATRGGDLLGFEGKVVAVISPRRKLVDVL
jgi:hypothetical protein